jgi:HTH-type transcriptional regulator / antitoxin HigA
MNKLWKVLETEEEYRIALKRTIEIFHAQQDTREGDELDVLLPLIIAYENIHFHILDPAEE